MARSTQLAYPVRLETDDHGAVLVSFPDIPEALTEGATEQEALAEAQDCLIAALGGYVDGLAKHPQAVTGARAPAGRPSGAGRRQDRPLSRDRASAA